jgi:ABC-2 type transport system ATP-binding protein
LVGAAVIAVAGRRRRSRAVEADLDDLPLVFDGLSKTYGEVVAVDQLSFRVERGQILGLLGPNGAGKTTALRMLMGLVHPSAGRALVFGQPVRPGSPALSRIGSFIEGPGLLPHLSGLDNLRLYWRATGRPIEDAHEDEVLAIAGLGPAVRRAVRTYSQGMRQRLAIAQAMLGLPELLVLDEPTNGLDPPQIRAFRDVLRDYATDGRTVVISSHLLAEVEVTCSHVVVMDRGRLVAAGSVTELVGADGSLAVAVDDPDRALPVVKSVDGVRDAVARDGEITVQLGSASAADVIDALVRAGIRVHRAAPRRRLEDAFVSLIGEEVQ